MAVPGVERSDAPARLSPGMASRRLLVLAFVRGYIGKWGQSPSYGEIAAGVGVSRVRAHQLVRKLVIDGQLLRHPGPRGLSLPETRDEALRVLRELNWTVDEKAARAAAPFTHSRLIAAPPLTYPHRVSGERGNGRKAEGQGKGGRSAGNTGERSSTASDRDVG